ncbi:MAG: hypothetical protein KDA67_03625 [Rhodobacteraceae bacterium]|nr:hypothetical protein [Paracoccaceae bacterium]
MKDTPLHLWIIGVLSLMWNMSGAGDYLMAKFSADAYLAMMSPLQQVYFRNFPVWVHACWGFGVWGAVLGSILLLMRSRWAMAAFAVSLVAMILNIFYGYVLADPAVYQISGIRSIVFSVVILVVAVFLLHYARHMRKAGVLR